jgi:hypothetical protein
LGVAPIIVVTTLLAASCGTVIIGEPVRRQGGGWDLTLRTLTDGPHSYKSGNTSYVAGFNHRFIWAHITLRNTLGVARKFNFDRCDLDAAGEFYVPAFIDADAVIGWEMNREPELAAGETITRKLIFGFPRKQFPSRLRCAPIEFVLPLSPTGSGWDKARLPPRKQSLRAPEGGGDTSSGSP